MLEPIAESVRQVGSIIDLVRGLVEIVLDPAVRHGLLIEVEHNVAGTVVVITWLADAANIDQHFFTTQLEQMIALVR